MTTDQRAEAVLQLIESDFGQSGRDVRFLAIRDELVTVINETKDRDAKIVTMLEPPYPVSQDAIEALGEAEKAILASKIKE